MSDGIAGPLIQGSATIFAAFIGLIGGLIGGIKWEKVSDFILKILDKNKNRGPILGVIIPDYDVLTSDDKNKIAISLEDELNKFSKKNPLWIDFHNNNFLVFLISSNENKQNSMIELFKFGEHLLRIGNQILKDDRSNKEIHLGIILDWETEAEFAKLHKSRFLRSAILSQTQTRLSFALNGHFLISERIHKDIYHIIKDTYEISPLNYYDIQKYPFKMWNIYHKDLGVGKPALPPEQIIIETRNSEVFIDRLAKASEVVIIGITHENLASTLETALSRRDYKFWEKLTVVFPSKEQLSYIVQAGRSVEERKISWDRGLHQVNNYLRGKGNFDKWQCLISTTSIPFTGTNITSHNDNNNDKRSSIRIAPIIPGSDIKENRFFEIQEGTPTYDAIERGFAAIVSTANQETEWILGCYISNNELTLSTVVDRKAITEYKHCKFPIVLILLFAHDENGELKLLLQERTIYNSSSNQGTLSNISGYLIDVDTITNDPTTYLKERSSNKTELFPLLLQSLGTKSITINESTWKKAAIREIREETGLAIEDSRLTPYKKMLQLTLTDDVPRTFNIFSLILKHDEFLKITKTRPHVNLKPHTFEDLSREYNKGANCRFNTILKHHQTVFMDIVSATTKG